MDESEQEALMKAKLAALSAALCALAFSAPAYASYTAGDFGTHTPTPAQQAPVFTATTSSSGFAWNDAGIGAGSMLAVLLAAAGSRTIVVRRRRNHPAVARHAAA